MVIPAQAGTSMDGERHRGDRLCPGGARRRGHDPL